MIAVTAEVERLEITFLTLRLRASAVKPIYFGHRTSHFERFVHLALKLVETSSVPHAMVSFPPPDALLKVMVSVSTEADGVDAASGVEAKQSAGSGVGSPH